MLKTGMLLCALCLAATTVLRADPLIEVEKLTKDQLEQAVQAASDDTVIEYQGQSRTKAQWRGDFQAKSKPLDAAKLKELAEERKAKFETAAKALQDDQDRAIAEQNAQAAKAFEALGSR